MTHYSFVFQTNADVSQLLVPDADVKSFWTTERRNFTKRDREKLRFWPRNKPAKVAVIIYYQRLTWQLRQENEKLTLSGLQAHVWWSMKKYHGSVQLPVCSLHSLYHSTQSNQGKGQTTQQKAVPTELSRELTKTKFVGLLYYY